MIKQLNFQESNFKKLICLHIVSMSNSSFLPIDRTQSGATTPEQREHGSNGNEWVHHISQISKTGIFPSDGVISYLAHSLVGVLPLAEMQTVYSKATADWVIIL